MDYECWQRFPQAESTHNTDSHELECGVLAVCIPICNDPGGQLAVGVFPGSVSVRKLLCTLLVLARPANELDHTADALLADLIPRCN